jgi:hypothetical protein
MIAHFVRNINSCLPGGWERVLPYGGRLVIKRRSARVERRQFRAKRSHTSNRWLWITKVKLRMYVPSWTTCLRWLQVLSWTGGRPQNGEGLRAIHINECMVSTHKETRCKAHILKSRKK